MARLWPVFSRKSVFTRQPVHIRGLGGTILPFWDLSALWLWASRWLENKDIVVRVQFGLIRSPPFHSWPPLVNQIRFDPSNVIRPRDPSSFLLALMYWSNCKESLAPGVYHQRIIFQGKMGQFVYKCLRSVWGADPCPSPLYWRLPLSIYEQIRSDIR